MSYVADIRENDIQSPGARVTDGITYRDFQPSWRNLWHELPNTPVFKALAQSSTTVIMSFAVGALPCSAEVLTDTSILVRDLEHRFGATATDIANMLRVSRPMVYHYREGMTPLPDTYRRLRTLAMLASEFGARSEQPIKGFLKAPQPEGPSMRELLSEEHLDVPVLRERLRIAADRALRERLAQTLAKEEGLYARSDITRQRYAEDKPVYIGDPDFPGRLIQVWSDGRRIRGHMVKRQFVPDEG